MRDCELHFTYLLTVALHVIWCSSVDNGDDSYDNDMFGDYNNSRPDDQHRRYRHTLYRVGQQSEATFSWLYSVKS